MIARYFCDFCTNEVESPASQPEFRTCVHLDPAPKDHTSDRSLQIKILRAMDDAWNAGHICNACLSQGLTQVLDQLALMEDASPAVSVECQSLATCLDPGGCGAPEVCFPNDILSLAIEHVEALRSPRDRSHRRQTFDEVLGELRSLRVVVS